MAKKLAKKTVKKATKKAAKKSSKKAAKPIKKVVKKVAKSAPKKVVKKVVKKVAKKAVKKAGKRTTMRSSKGKKLYAVRDAEGQFKDIQSYDRAHGSDVQRESAEERAADAAASAATIEPDATLPSEEIAETNG